MTGSTRSSADLDPRRRRALIRAWRRGMREMDLVLGGFADAHIGSLTTNELEQFEALLEVSDTEVLSWVTGRQRVPEAFDTELFRRILAACISLTA